MKKILMIVCLLFILIGCRSNDTEPTDTTDDSLPNGLTPLIATEDCLVPTLDDGWVCIWADEFEGDTVDETKWHFEDGGYGGGNRELQYYTRNNTTVEDGKLIITSKLEDMDGKRYTSSRLNTKYKASFQYVRISVSAKMPSGNGTWPAIWMMPLMNVYGGWPNSGEIDIMEYVGRNQNEILSTIHTKKFNHNLGTQLGYHRVYENVETEFKNYEMIWMPGTILTYVDGDKLGEFNYTPAFNQEVPYYDAHPFDQEFFLIINLAIGGTLAGAVDDAIFPQTFEIEHVRVYKKDYAVLDKEAPEVPTEIRTATLKNTLWWLKSHDDIGVEKYAIYLDGEFHKYANLQQVTLTGLNVGQSYQVQIQAIDFVGRVSEKSEIFTLNYT